MNEVKEIRLSLEQTDDLVSKIRKLMDAEFGSIKTNTEHGKIYRAEQECEIIKEVYRRLLITFGVDSYHFRPYKLIAVKHIESIERGL